MKNTKKTVKPSIVMDLNNVETPEDVKSEFIFAKIRAGKKITTEEAEYLVRYGSKLTFEVIDEALVEMTKGCNIVNLEGKEAERLINVIKKELGKKDPWYKRFWNWVKKPFSKKK